MQMYSIDRVIEKTSIEICCVHPGFVDSEFFRDVDSCMFCCFKCCCTCLCKYSFQSWKDSSNDILLVYPNKVCFQGTYESPSCLFVNLHFL